MSRPQNPLTGALFALAAFALYSGYDISIKFLGAGYSSFQIIFFAGLLALLVSSGAFWDIAVRRVTGWSGLASP